MPAECAAEDTPRPKQRAFTDTTETWFAAGDDISETPQNDVYADEAPQPRRWLIHGAAIAVGWGAGLFAAWLVL